MKLVRCSTKCGHGTSGQGLMAMLGLGWRLNSALYGMSSNQTNPRSLPSHLSLLSLVHYTAVLSSVLVLKRNSAAWQGPVRPQPTWDYNTLMEKGLPPQEAQIPTCSLPTCRNCTSSAVLSSFIPWHTGPGLICVGWSNKGLLTSLSKGSYCSCLGFINCKDWKTIKNQF